MIRHRDGRIGRPGFHPGPNFRHHRLQRGFFMHPFWFGPQFHVQNWQLYGFAQPPRDHRWVRFYDDAYLIDRTGRIADHRYGLDWDEYGERWGMDDGVPYYHGSGDWRPDEDDYAWVEGQDRDWDDEDGYADRYADRGYYRQPAPVCHQGPQPCGGPVQTYPVHAYPGYGYGVAYPIIIETTVTTTGACCEEVIEEVVEVRQRPQRRHRSRTVRRPRPPAGERG